MTHQEQIEKLCREFLSDAAGGYTKEELQHIYSAAKQIMVASACAIAEWDD